MATQDFSNGGWLAHVPRPITPSSVAWFQRLWIAAQSGSTAGTFCEVGRGLLISFIGSVWDCVTRVLGFAVSPPPPVDFLDPHGPVASIPPFGGGGGGVMVPRRAG